MPAHTPAAATQAPVPMDVGQHSDNLPQSQDLKRETASNQSQLLCSRSVTEAPTVSAQLEAMGTARGTGVQTVPVSVNPPEIVSTESFPVPQASTSQVNVAESPTSLPIDCSECDEPLLDSPQPIGYSLQLPLGHEIRNYQRELAEPGIRGDNYIYVAPTGSGKTLVAAIVICEHLKKLQALGEVPKVIFLVTTKPLAEQQQNRLQDYIGGAKVECVVGDSIVSIKHMLTQCQIVVCTTGKFRDELKRGWVSLTPDLQKDRRNSITLLVMDECHHARKSSVQAQLMHHYLMQRQEAPPGATFPQVVGITASPGAGENPSLEIEKTIDHLIKLCAMLDASGGIATVRENVEELERYTTKPTLSRDILRVRDQNERFIALIENEMAKLESTVKLKCAFPRWSQKYETFVNQTKLPYEISTNIYVRDQISTLKLLVCFCQALNIYMDLRQEDALKVLEDYSDLPEKDETCTDCERALKRDLYHLVISLKALPQIENPMLKRAKEVLVERFIEAPESRGVFFIRTKRHAYAVCEWIKSLAISYPFLKPQVITGYTRETGDTTQGMSAIEQEAAMEAFRSGGSNILVATSVAEEGIDVPACNFVIRFLYVSNEIAKVQAQGRARAEDSEVITIMSSESKLSMREMQNTERLDLVNKIIDNNWFPKGEWLKTKLKEQQGSLILSLKFKQLFKEHQKSAERDKIKLMCRKCKTVACRGSDVFTAEGNTHYVVPGKEFLEKVIKKPHPKPGRISEKISKTHKIFCKKCDADWPWGVMCVWLKDRFEFPVLKCGSFILQEGEGTPFQISQWTKAPFKAPPLEVWIAGQVRDSEELEDSETEQ